MSAAVIGALTFRFARTMPDLPHEYTARNRADPAAEAAYVELSALIQAHGVREWAPARPGKKRYRNRYWYAGDGFKYWAMTTNIAFSIVINRTRVEFYDADNNPLPEFVEAAQRAAAVIAGWPAADRRHVTLAQAIALGGGGASLRRGGLTLVARTPVSTEAIGKVRHTTGCVSNRSPVGATLDGILASGRGGSDPGAPAA